MLSDLLITLILLIFIIPGLKHPYILLGGLVFVDLMQPQSMSQSFLSGKPLSLIMTALFFLSILINFKKLSWPRIIFPSLMLVMLMIWITITTFLAEFEYYAWIKYDYVIKTLFVCLFIPFVLNSRVKIDTFIGMLVVTTSFVTVSAGVKTLFSGGGYGNNIYMSVGNSGFSESSTVSMIAVIMIPLTIYIAKHSIYSNTIPKIKLVAYAYAFFNLLAVIGTYARTGLVGLFVLGAMNYRYILLKVKIFIPIAILFLIVSALVSDEWIGRMETISDSKSESSAYGRIVVWRWTLDYVKDRPFFGGGFQSFLANAGELQNYIVADTSISHTETGKAYHSIYFEVLGEHGYVGLGIYLILIYLCVSIARKIRKQTLENSWENNLSVVIVQVTIIYSVCGAFIGVAFYPWLYYLLGIAVALDNVVHKKQER